MYSIKKSERFYVVKRIHVKIPKVIYVNHDYIYYHDYIYHDYHDYIYVNHDYIYSRATFVPFFQQSYQRTQSPAIVPGNCCR